MLLLTESRDDLMINKLTLTPTAYTQPAPADTQIEPPATIRRTRGIASTRYLWKQNSTLNISLFDMPEKAKDYVKKNILLWQPYTNLKFNFITSNDGDIRISGTKKESTSHSFLGTQATRVPKDQPTMHIDLHQTADMLNHAIRHEFGHALGLEHEHDHPDHPVHWDRTKLDKEAERIGLSKAEEEFDFLTVLDPSTTTRSAYDPQSIMHYRVPAWFTTDGVDVPFNEEISEGDKKFMALLYPPASESTTPSSN